MHHTSRQDTKLTLGELEPVMRKAAAAFMRGDPYPVNALLATLPGNEVLEEWARGLQRQWDALRQQQYLASIQEYDGCGG